MTVDERLQNRLKHWKAQLIDTSKRNRLLYFKPSPTGTVQLVEPSLQDIYNRLVGRAQHLQFYPLEPEENLLDFDEADDNSHNPPPLPPLRADEVRSNLSDKRLWKTLYALRQKARTSLQEQGVVTLFVAFGLLEWTESPSSNIRFQSPLLLAPVELLHESGISTYRLKLFEEDVTLNPTLIHKMNVDFGLTLPGLPESDTVHLETYFKQVVQCVSSNRGWSVVPGAYLGLFSFHKIAMYKDLEARAERAYSHPIIRALAGDTSGLPSVPTDLPSEADLDRVVSPENTFQILDADSSQQEAIQAAKRGVSFVLQGPPGTGKSQTIANIIAERLGDGKKVLFVSEKMAALNVVYRRLSDHGLAEFCLQAHSHKANKKEVVQELGRTLPEVRRAPAQMDVDFSEFMRLKERLNAYVSALHVVRSPIQRTAYQIHGEQARLDSAPDLQFSFDNIAQITPGALSHINELLDELTRVQDVIASYSHHPWFGVHIHPYHPNEAKADIRAHFNALIDSLNDLEERASSRATLCGVERPVGLADVERLIALFQLVAVTPYPPSAWFRPSAPTLLMEEAQAYQTRFTDYHGRRNALLQVYQESVFDLPHDDLEARLTTRHQAILDRIKPEGEARGDALIRQRAALQTALFNTSQLLERLGRDVPALATACALDAANTLTFAEELYKTAALLARDPKPQKDWFDRPRLVALRTEAEEARSQYDSYLKVRDNIHTRYEDTFLALDQSALLGRFTGAYSGFLRVFHPGYYRDLRALRSELKASGKLGYEDAVRDLKAGRQYADRKRWIEEHQAVHARDFGRHFNGLDTAWDGILDSLETCRRIVDRLGDGRVPEGMIHLLVASGPPIAAIHRQQETVEAELNRLEQELNGLQQLISLETLPFTDKPLHEVELSALKTWVDEVAGSVADYCAARDAAISCRKADADPNTTEIAAVVSDLSEARSLVRIESEVQSHADELRTEFGHLFEGMETQWEEVLAALDWTRKVLDWFGTTAPPPVFVAVASGEEAGAKQVGDFLPGVQQIKQRSDEEIAYVSALFTYTPLSIEGHPFNQASLEQVRDWTQTRLDRLAELDRWMDFQRLSGECQQAGLGSFLGAICRDTPEAALLKPAFYKRFWALWLDSIEFSDAALTLFDGQRHEAHIARFRELDRAQMQQAQRRLRERLLNQRPIAGVGIAPSGEMSVLKKEIGKKTRHKPLRRLFAEMPNLLLALKPCLLMSPLSVATFLDSNVVEFDVVIFDEASQICSEDAVGAIMRGKQVIVVGDSKQLPPTRFFATSITDDYDTEEEEEEAATEVYESILDECATIGLPDPMLRWHYRSRCEALIAFSNQHLYDNRLVTFPGPYVQAGDSADRCVEFVIVPEGVYVRGKGKDAGTNRIEAMKVAELVFRHFDTQPNRSLGVIAFSERQQTAIDDEIRRLRNLRPEYTHFFAEEGDEPFFIKNLENVQGDERDVILFSVGYGRDQVGKLSINFGPLNKEGGERRLNVAVTRAKHQVKLISSIQPQDIDLSRTQAKGVALLKYYMEFAQRGPSALARTITAADDPEFESPFEEEVCRALEERGLAVHRQIGCAGYRIDLAVVDDVHPGRYLLGIECDGAMYHSSKTARDRDRLRQQVLEDMGWQGRILRIWSSDWIKSPEAHVLRVVEALARARHAADESPPVLAVTQDAHEDAVAEVDTVEDEEPPFESICGETEAPDPVTLPEGVVPYRAYIPRKMGTPDNFYYLAEYKPGSITDILVEVVRQEGPIHIMEATRRVVANWGMGKAGSVLVQHVKEAARRAIKRGEVKAHGDFLWPSDMVQAVVRVPTESGSARPIEYVPLEEIAEACYLCVESAFGIQRYELATYVARRLGYDRTGAKVLQRIEEGIDLCVKQRRIEIKDDFVRLVPR